MGKKMKKIVNDKIMCEIKEKNTEKINKNSPK